MEKESLVIKNIPAILWGKKSDSVYIFVHGKKSSKEEAEIAAEIATKKGHQVLSFDLPEHGERKDEDYACDICNGIHDLNIIGDYAKENWSELNLYANSLGAYFSLMAYKDLKLNNCLFISPILDMERLILNMMKWFNINYEMLREKLIIPTPIGETLDWNYYCYVKENPVNKWNVPTSILYGSLDNMTEHEIVESFTEKFNCDLTILQGSEHWFHSEEQISFLKQWLIKHI